MTVAQLLAGNINPLPQEGVASTSSSTIGSEHSSFDQLLSQFQAESGLSEGIELTAPTELEQSSMQLGLIEKLIQLLPTEWKKSADSFELELETETTDEADLYAFLQQVDDQFSILQEDGSEEELEALYTLFQQIPITLTRASRAEETVKSQGTPAEQLFLKNDEAIVIVKWSKLLETINQSMKQADETEGASRDLSQIRDVMSNMKNLFHQENGFRQFLLNRFTGELSQLDVQSQSSKGSREPGQFFQSYLPTSLLTKVHTELSSTNEGSAQLDDGVQAQKDGSFGNKLAEQMGSTQEAKIGQAIKAAVPEETVPTARLSHFVQDMKEVMKNHFQQLHSQDVSQIRIKLSPEHLGHLDIRILSIEGKISALVTTSNNLAREALEHQMSQLRVALTQQGLQVDRIEVTQQNSSNNTLFNQEQRSGQQFSNEKNGKSTVEEEFVEEDDQIFDFDNDLEESSNINYVV